MEEKDLIVKYLERVGGNVIDMFYYQENIIEVSAKTVKVGVAKGIIDEKVFFFGNVTIYSSLAGAIVLANLNGLQTLLMHEKGSGQLDGGGMYLQTVGNGLYLMGDGTYEGVKRLYGLGFNRVMISGNGIGEATFQIRVYLNGILYLMK